MKRFVLFAAIAVAACGGKTKTGTVVHSDDMEHGNGAAEHDNLPPTVAAFHDKLSPLWHAEPGGDRVKDTCGSTGELGQLIADIDKATPPVGVDGGAWSEHVTALATAWTALTDDCVKNNAGDFDNAFGAAHTAFHALIDLL